MSDSSVELNFPSDSELQKASESESTYRSRRKEKPKRKTREIETPKEELKYRAKKSENILSKEKLSCTCCGKNLKGYLSHSSQFFSHPILGVLLCKNCADFYGEGEFSVDEDGTDKYCRWCGQGGTLYLCSKCNFGFCRACIKRNLQRSTLNDVEEDDWKCFACKPYPLWDLRALCDATLKFVKKQKKSKSKLDSRPSTSKSTKVITISSSETDGEQVKRKSSKNRKIDDYGSDSSVKKKRKRTDSNSSSGESLEKKKKRISSCSSKEKKEGNKNQYSKALDREITLDRESAEALVSKCEEQVGDLTKVLDAISSEIKKLLKEDVIVENMLEYAGRKNMIKKMILLQEMSCESITQVFDNFALAYQSGIVNCFRADSEKKKPSSPEGLPLPEKSDSDVIGNVEKRNKTNCVDEKMDTTTTQSDDTVNPGNDSEKLLFDEDNENISNKTDVNVNELEMKNTKSKITKNAFSESDSCDEDLLFEKTSKKCSSKMDCSVDSPEATKTNSKISKNAFSETDNSDDDLPLQKSRKETGDACKTKSSKGGSVKSPDFKEIPCSTPSDGKEQKEIDIENISESDIPKYTVAKHGEDKLENCDSESRLNNSVHENNKNNIDTGIKQTKSVTAFKQTGDLSQSHKVANNEENTNTNLCPQDSDDQEDKSDNLDSDNTVCESEKVDSSKGKISNENHINSSKVSEAECTTKVSNGEVTDKNEEESELSPEIPKILLKMHQDKKNSDDEMLSNNEKTRSEKSFEKDDKTKTVNAKMNKGIDSESVVNSGGEKSETHCSDTEKKVVLSETKYCEEKNKISVLSDEDVISDSGSEKLSRKKLQSSGNNDSPNDDVADSDENTCSKNGTKSSSNNSLLDSGRLHGTDVENELENMVKEIETNSVPKIVEAHNSQNGVSNESDESKSDKLSTSLLSDGKYNSNKKSDIDNKNGNCTTDKDQDNSDKEKKALLSLLASSSSDDDSSSSVDKKSTIKFSSDENIEKCGPLSSKSIAYQIANKKRNEIRSGVFSDASESMDVDSACELKRRLKRSSKNSEDSEEANKVTQCSVVLKRLPDDVYKKHAESPGVSESSRGMSESEEIKKLVDLKSLEKSSKKKIPSVDSEDEETNINKRKVYRKHAKKKEKKTETLKDFHDKNDDSSQSDSSDTLDQKCIKDSGLKNIFADLCNQKNKLAKELLLRSSSSDSDMFPSKDKHEKKKEKKKESEMKVKEEKQEDVKQEDVKQEDVKQEDVKQEITEKKDSDESEEEMKKKKKWRSDKLLRMRLSETDSSDEDRRWKAKKDREAKRGEKESDSEGALSKKINSKKPVVRRIINSDSDSIILSSDSTESDGTDSDDFKTFMKRKRKENSDSSKSDKKSSASGSEVSMKKTAKRRRIRKPVSDSNDTDEDNGLNNSQKSDTTPGKGRKNIRKVLKDDDVAEATQRAAKEEEERRKRIAEKQKLYNALYNLAEAQSKTIDKLVLDFDSETKEELLQVDKNLVTKLKPHQAKGVKFMWDACFESLEQAKMSEGSGCILAHCMGLGKTLQVITLIHTIMKNPATKMNTVLVVCPLSTVLNWVAEFAKWLEVTEDDDIEILDLTKYKQMYERVGILKHWHENGGVMILSYNSYRTLANPKIARQKKKNIDTLQSTLVDPGPDLVICDEGHLLKNEGSALSKTMNRIRTKRRIVLTGTPLQNNLLEYHCMVQFVKPNLLGTKKEFQNRFVNPINNGQYGNSTAHDVKVMKRRAHVLHKMLDSSVQRHDYSVLTPFLPPKFEYVLLIKLTELQIKLYKYFLENISFVSISEGTKTRTARLFSDFQSLQRIWTHPRVLLMNSEKMEKKRVLEDSDDSEGSLKDFIASSSSESSSSSNSSVEKIDSPKSKRKTRSTANNGSDDEVKSIKSNNDEGEKDENVNTKHEDWWQQFITDESLLDDINQSGKLALLFKILEECEKIGDKILIFSQSLQSLDLIEYFLRKIDEASDEANESEVPKQSWVLGLDYFRLDGSSSPENRAAWCKIFNREDNYRARLFLISTRAGGLGINLVAANRVILFDASWNPSYDLQSIFRIYRFGQKKPCYVYRFLAQHTMEEKVYNRQVTKLSLACRVVDEQQIERHFSMDDLQELYNFNPEEKKSKETPLVPKDVLLAELVKGENSWVENYHEHDTLLENKEEEELNEEERKAAWEDYEKEKQGIRTSAGIYDNSAIFAYLNKFGYSETEIRERIVQENPLWSEVQVNFHITRVLRQILDYVAAEENRKQQMQYAKQPMFYQNPQIHSSAMMLPRMQSQIQAQMQGGINKPYTNNQFYINHSQGNFMQNPESMPGTSLNADDAQHRIKVKSFGHMQNSNFENSHQQQQQLINPFSIQHTASTSTMPTPSTLRSVLQNTPTNQTGTTKKYKAIAPKQNLPSDVINVE